MKAAEEQLREMQERFQATFERAGVGVAHVTDCMLPGMPGIEFVRRLRERSPDVRAILISG